MIHLVFQEADIHVLNKSFEMDESLAGDIVLVKDDFAVGPLADVFTAEGTAARKQWWRDVLAGGDYDGLVDNGSVDDTVTVEGLIKRLDEDASEVLWIWAAQNKHDVSGYYWLISQLAYYQGRIFILYLNNLPFIGEKGNLFYPENLYEIPPREFLKARKLARKVTASEFEIDTDEWKKICEENKSVRVLEGGKKLVQHSDDFYDEALLKFITGDWLKSSKLITTFLNKSTHPTGDAYLLWRIKKMIEAGTLQAQGEIRNMKEFEVKLAMPENVKA